MTPQRMERLRRQAAEARDKITPEKRRANGLAHADRISAYKETQGFEEKRKSNRLKFVRSDAGRATINKVMSMPGMRAGLGHINEKTWSVRDPMGKTHRFRNLCEFVRNNQSMFIPEDSIPRKICGHVSWISTRAYSGLSGLRPSNKKKTTKGQWKGWVWVMLDERALNNAVDPMDRIA